MEIRVCVLFCVFINLSVNSQFTVVAHGEDSDVEEEGTHLARQIIDVRMPAVRTTEEDEYLHYAWKVPDGKLYIVQFKALADASNVHHMLVYGCQNAQLGRFWKGSPCQNGDSSILYAWAQNAPPLQLPKDVGFRIGTDTNVNFVVIQVHYRMPTKVGDPSDSSGVELTITTERQTYIGGIFLMLVNYLLIPAHAPVVHGDSSCRYSYDTPLYPFAARTHSHALGKVTTGYHVNDTWHMFAKGNPQWPQAFYPLASNVVIKKGDKLVARCTFNASDKAVDTYIGSTHNDEMCNLYIMYYTANGGKSYYLCSSNDEPELASHIPADSDVPLPPNPLLDEIAVGHMHHGIQVVTNFSNVNLFEHVNLGQISGVATDSMGHVHIFHRGIRVWDFSSFEYGNRFLKTDLGPIPDNTLLELDPVSGELLKQWGANIFFMCHGLTIDHHNNFWITDVALHQVMKFRLGSDTPELTLGVKFEPGNDNQHFCKPTDVAVLDNGEFFVSDGYCNHRVIKFSPDGKFLMQWGKSDIDNQWPGGSFLIPHSITVDERRGQVHVADRENGRLQTFDLEGNLLSIWNDEQLGPKLFAVTYHNTTDKLYAVNGVDLSRNSAAAIVGSIWDPGNKSLVATWQPKNEGFLTPHDVAVSPNGQYIYVVEIGPNRLWQFRNYDISLSTNADEVVHDHSTMQVNVTHQSVKKSGVSTLPSILKSLDDDPNSTSNRRLDGSTLVLVIASLCTVPLVIAIVATLCVRQCCRNVGGYRKLNANGMNLKNNRPSIIQQKLIAVPGEYKDVEGSDDEKDKLNVS